MKRMIINVQAMITDTVMALEIKDNALLENIISGDDEVDRYHFYMMKETLGNTGKKNDEMLSKIRGKNISTSAITEEISRIGMYSTDIAEITMDAHCYRHESTRI